MSKAKKPKKWHPPKAKATLDKLWSLCVRGRDKRCTFCGREGGKLDANHIMSRRHLATRWDLDNGNALCFFCHIQIFHRDPVDGARRVKLLIGELEFDKLYAKSRTIQVLDRVFYEVKKIELERFLKEVE